MPDKVVQRTKVAEGLAVLAVVIALVSSSTIYVVNSRSIDRVNSSRVEVTFINCKEINQRNIDAITFLEGLANKQVKQGKITKKKADEAIANYRLLFAALSPIQDCQALVQRRYGIKNYKLSVTE